MGTIDASAVMGFPFLSLLIISLDAPQWRRGAFAFSRRALGAPGWQQGHNGNAKLPPLPPEDGTDGHG